MNVLNIIVNFVICSLFCNAVPKEAKIIKEDLSISSDPYTEDNIYNRDDESNNAAVTTPRYGAGSNITSELKSTSTTTTAPKTDDQDCVNNICYQKCCPVGQMYSLETFGCVAVHSSHKDWIPEIMSLGGSKQTVHTNLIPTVGLPTTCESYGPSLDTGHLLKTGEFYIPYLDKIFKRNKYCYDVIYAPIGNFASFELPCKQIIGMTSITCFEPRQPNYYDNIRSYLHPVTIMLSCIGLALMIFCNASIKQLRKKQKGLSPILTSHAIALLLGNLMLFVINIPGNTGLNDSVCKGIGIVIHYTFLAAFFWLNIMCYDMWAIIRKSVIQMLPLWFNLNKVNRKILWYSLYGWGCPLIIVTISVVINFLPNGVLPCGTITPQYGVGQCWMPRRKDTLFLYFYGYAAALFVINLWFLLHIAYLLSEKTRQKIWIKIKQFFGLFDPNSKNNDVDIENSSETRITRNANYKKIFIQRTSIFALLAVFWVFEVVSLIFGPREIWALTDLLNTLQGFFLFLIFIRTNENRHIIARFLSEYIDGAHNNIRKLSISNSSTMSTMNSFLSSLKSSLNKKHESDNIEPNEEITFKRNNKNIKHDETSSTSHHGEPIKLLSFTSIESGSYI